MRLLVKLSSRKIKKTLGRFFSILFIVALGIGFFAGIRNTSDNMLDTLDQYYDEHQLFQLKLMSDMGIGKGELRYLEEHFDIDVVPSYSTDVEVGNHVIRAHAINSVNTASLKEGIYPKNKNECLAEQGVYSIGDTVLFSSSSFLSVSSCTVVGTIESPFYIGKEKGFTTIGNGKLYSYLYLPSDSFQSEYYTEVYFIDSSITRMNSYHEDFENMVGDLHHEIEQVLPTLKTIRYQEMVDSLTGYDVVLEQQILSQIREPQYYLFDRTDLSGYSEFYDDALRVDSIASVFPLFFLIVAALVCLNTMIRFVEEERVEFGILKALGYSNFAIIFGYVFYVSLATLVGSILGLLIGYQVLPRAIYSIYHFSYDLPNILISIPINISIYLVLLALLLVNGVTVYACYHTLHEQPSQLLRPKVVEKGKNILLEKISFIWKRLNFINKVTMRNIFRYKKRFFMTVLGIAGCMALLVTGVGLRDSIGGVVSKQFDYIFSYDGLFVLQADTEELPDSVSAILERYSNGEYALVSQKSYMFKANDKLHDCMVMVPQEWATFRSFVHLYELNGDYITSLPEEGVVLSEKMASLLHAQEGDIITLQDSSYKTYSVKVAYIAQNYVGHYLYISPDYYSKIFGDPNYSVVLHTIIGNEEEYAQEMLSSPEVMSVNITKDMKETFDTMIVSLNKIVVVILLAACILAFVVLYNLTIINITERQREIATLKVLGFYDKEVSSYIYKESMLLTCIGIFGGIFLGMILHGFVMDTAEMDVIKFPRKILVSSYICSAVLTIIFTLITFIVTNRKLKNIDMIDSLKSVE